MGMLPLHIGGEAKETPAHLIVNLSQRHGIKSRGDKLFRYLGIKRFLVGAKPEQLKNCRNGIFS